jgi:predicted polyphosphate/ATP-dependent NAD kinase
VVTVGVIANPASGRDIRRLVTGASVFDNAEKGSMVFRLLAGLGATGVEKVWMMPAGEGLSGSLDRRLRSHTGRHGVGDTTMPALEMINVEMRGDAGDSTRAARAMVDHGVRAIAVLGGDGTNRVVAAGSGDVPLCPLSTGTNNAFPSLLEATVAGLATGLVATRQVPLVTATRRHKRLDVRCGDATDIALVDVAASTDRFVGARALWKVDHLGDAIVTFANPAAVGLSAIAGHVHPVARTDDHGLHLRLGPPETADTTVTVALAPGLITHVGVSDAREVALGESVSFAPADGCLALDGEREIERNDDEDVTVTLAPGPLVIDVEAVMTHAAANGMLVGGATQRTGVDGRSRPSGVARR